MPHPLVLGAASWNRMVYVDALPQGSHATIFEAQETEAAGSTGTGKAMALAALGVRTVFHCALGQDEAADRIETACTERGIRMLIDRHPEPTPRHLNLMDRSGGRYSVFVEGGAPAPAIDTKRLSVEIDRAKVIFLSLCASSKQSLFLLNSSQSPIWLDLHDYDGANPWYDDFIALADVIQMSDVALADPHPVIRRLLSGRAKTVVLTKGGAGAEIHTRAGAHIVSALPATVCDSNGAGDAFQVGLWYGMQNGLSLPDSGRFAAACAAATVEDPGLIPPTLDPSALARRAGLNWP